MSARPQEREGTAHRVTGSPGMQPVAPQQGPGTPNDAMRQLKQEEEAKSPAKEADEQLVDETSEESFPASDPPAWTAQRDASDEK